jgi:CMP-N-acetylneuraminic acid synthetase
MTAVAIVPARSGSKRVPGKNVRLLGGRPLVHWTLAACIEAPSIDRVIFSTDSQEYWEGARRAFGEDKLVLDRRDAEEAGDKVKIFDYIKGAREKLFRDGDSAFVLCLPTVPLRTSAQIEEAVDLFRRTNKPVFSATAYGYPISFAFYADEPGSWTPAIEPSPLMTGNTRSQDQKEAFRPNGAIYVRNPADLARAELKTFFIGAQPYMMDARSSVDIDSEADFELAEFYLARGGR